MVVARAVDEGEITDRCVCGAGGIVKYAIIAKNFVGESGIFSIWGKGAYGIVETSFTIVSAPGFVEQRSCSNRHVLSAGVCSSAEGVQQKRGNANGRI